MTVVRPNSIAGINSITVQTGQALNIHDASGNLIRNITSSSGVSTFSSLHVGAGTTTSTQGISVGTGCSIVSTTANQLELYTNSSQRLNITSAGDFGTGGVTPTTQSGRVFHLHAGSAQQRLHMTNNTTGVTATDGFEIIVEQGANTRIRNFEAGDMAFDTGGSDNEAMRIDSSGRLLIGHTSSLGEVWNNDGGSLQVAGTSYLNSTFQISRWTNSASCPHIIMGKSRGGAVGTNVVVQDGDTAGIIAFAADDGTDLHSAVAEIRAQVDGTPGSNDMPGRLIFSTTADGANSRTEHLRIDQAGKITIGGGIQDQEAADFNSGANQLLITSDGATGLTIDATSSTSSSIHFADGSTGSESYRGIIEYNHANDYFSFGTSGSHRLKLEDGDLTLNGPEGISANLYLIADEGDDNGDGWRIGSNQDDNDLTFANNDSGSYVDILTLIHKVGNTSTNMFLWGQGVTDNNEAMLTVKGTTTGGTDRHSQLMVAKHSGLTNLASAMRWQSDDGTTRYLYMDNNVVVRLSGNYSDIGTTSGTVIGSQSSDIRLKNLIGDGSVPYGLSEINQLNPIKFKYKKTGGDPDRIQIGFSAQQVKPIIPEAVYDTGEEVEGEENILGMDYVNIIPALVNSIKELTAEVESLKTQVAELKSS